MLKINMSMMSLSFISKLFSTPKFEILSQNSEYHFVLKSRSGEVILTSEPFKNRSSVLKTIDSVRRNSIIEKNFEIRTGIDEKKYFVLKAGNRKIIGISEMYDNIFDVENAIKSVRKYSKTQKVNYLD
jgi:uncharacterized protein YegP (UPF0339 family)